MIAKVPTQKIVFTSTHRGTQFGDVLSTSQVANNFMGTGLWGVEPVETSRRVPPVSAMLSRSHCFGAVRLRIGCKLPVKLECLADCKPHNTYIQKLY